MAPQEEAGRMQTWNLAAFRLESMYGNVCVQSVGGLADSHAP